MATKREHVLRTRLSRPAVQPISHIVGVLLVLGIGALAFHTEAGVDNSRKWVVHTYDVRTDLQNLELSIARARAARSTYLVSGDPEQFAQVQHQLQNIPQLVEGLKALTADNPRQQGRIKALEPLLAQQIADMGEISPTPESTKVIPSERTGSTRRITDRQEQVDTIIQDMSKDEFLLLGERLGKWTQLYRRNQVALVLALGAAVLLLIFNFRMLLAEVGRAKEMQRLERENSESYRALSARILEVQDTERRHVARELHDSIGQYLAGLKINLSWLESGKAGSREMNAQLYSETRELVDRAIGEVRTISHLLHPPLLDELGFDSAARWYVDEFAKRGGVQVKMSIGEAAERLPRSIELALFRILQESLTNVHRHANAHSVTIGVAFHDEKVFMTVRDDGQGVRPELLQQFRAGMAAGVGLAGLKERIAELEGELQIESSAHGTTIRATLPTSVSESRDNGAK